MSHVTLDATGAERFRFLPSSERKRVVLILASVGEATGVGLDEIDSRTRTDRVSSARQLAMVIISKALGMSSIRTGYVFDRDHATILHALKCVAARRATDPAFAALYDRLLSQAKA